MGWTGLLLEVCIYWLEKAYELENFLTLAYKVMTVQGQKQKQKIFRTLQDVLYSINQLDPNDFQFVQNEIEVSIGFQT